MRRLYTRPLAALIAVGALTLSACGGGGGTQNEPKVDISKSNISAVAYEDLKDGGTVTTAIEEISPQQNTFHADGTRYTRDLWAWYNPQLALFDEKGNYSFNKEYLKDVKEEKSGENTKVTFSFNDKATFNDGTPIDWRTIEATWKISNGKDPAYSPDSTDGYEQIKSVTKGATDRDAVVEFEGTYPWWQGLFNLVVHPAVTDPANYNDYLKKVHPEWGAGPYKVENVDFNKGEATFVKNEKWWGRPGKLDKRVFRQMESSASLNAFKNGEIDVTLNGNKERYSATKDMPNTQQITGPIPSTSLFTLNGKSPVLSDIKVREAVATAIDREQIGKIRFNGIPYEEKTPGSLQIFQFQTDVYKDNYAQVIPKADPEKAKKLLEEAGYTKGADGVYEKNGQKLTIRYVLLGDAEVSRAMAQATQKMLKDVGIDCQIQQRPSSEFSQVAKQRDFDLFPMGFAASDPYGMAYFGQTYLSDSQLNKSDTGTPELDAKIQEMRKLPTQKEQIDRGNELEVEAFKRFGVIPMYNGPTMAITKNGLANAVSTGFQVNAVETVGWKK
ncbi:ABC transporter family substrate-binding protein [Corynebacterium epidermidicanis]|uniref:ABC-type dipeptide transport system, periplasmic component n=1 Tax=Corynebacterium epidermidicanis TaxID=1050174 RepID=A0A0G3GQM1_9CORY|nr:ABC transporter family substrate-binding protein [Corynebacterium epidermidicanis]AKK03434.1 ABC-type dipeptide transport system, periplasmic component [Corynebacterium epidermidicanis]